MENGTILLHRSKQTGGRETNGRDESLTLTHTWGSTGRFGPNLNRGSEPELSPNTEVSAAAGGSQVVALQI